LEKEEVKEKIKRIALENAIKHEGKAQAKAVMSRLIGENPSLREKARDLFHLTKEIVEEVNSLTLEQQISIARNMWPEILLEEKKKIEEEKKLPPLPNVDK